MASKRKRRRLAAAKKRRAVAKLMVNNKETSMDYRVAVQKLTTDPMRIFTVREENPAELLPFIARIMGVSDIKDLAHLDVHLPLADGSVRVVHESAPEWPKHVKVKQEPGLVVRGKATTPPTAPAAQSKSKDNFFSGLAFAVTPAKLYKLAPLTA